MQCPVCKDAQLSMSSRENIEIDFCPQCRGVWLDRGELDKIIERSQRDAASAPQAAPQFIGDPRAFRGEHGHGGGHHGSRHGSGHEGFLKRLFD
jgi:Zn-finger nucleic acid-binding protein